MIERLRHSMKALQMLMRSQEVTANNLANINTPGFKADRVYFQSVLEKVNGELTSSASPYQVISEQQGVLEPTGNPLDLAINGKGFFKVEKDDAIFLTRNGRFSIDPDGFLVDEHGGQLQGTSGSVQVPTAVQSALTSGKTVDIEIAKDGSVRVDGELQDKIELVSVEDPSQLQRRSGSYFAIEQPGMQLTQSEAEISQGYFESGNVNPVMELVNMTNTMRMFESQQKAMQTTDEILSQVTNNLGRF